MSTSEKNIAIAEMLGAIIENWYPPNKDNGTSGNYLVFPNSLYEYVDDKGEKKQHRWYPDNKRQHCDSLLKFDSDANWQYEAIEFIEQLDHSKFHYKWVDTLGEERCNFMGYTVEVERTHCWVTCDLQLDPARTVVHGSAPTKKEAVFEALYEFSQYVKDLI